MLDWGNLEYFISCANHGTIEKLEKELAIKLFERRSSGYALTIHGKDYIKKFKKLISFCIERKVYSQS